MDMDAVQPPSFVELGAEEPVKRHTRKKRVRPERVVAASVLAIIAFAFFWEAFAIPKLTGAVAESGASNDGSSEAAISKIQQELNDSDWVDQQFLPVNEYSRPGIPLTEVKGIVIHYIGNPNTSAIKNRNYFASLATLKNRFASSNFIVDLDGGIIQCVPVDEIAYASNDRNADTLSIELCHPDETGVFNEETYASAIALSAWLCDKYGLTSKDIIRHYDVSGKPCPLYFVENEDAWDIFKAGVDYKMKNG